MIRLVFLGVLSWLCMAASAAADDRATCQNARGEPAMQACTRAIESKTFTGRELAGLYLNRGVEFKQKGDVDAAIADYDRAITIYPEDPFAFNNRARIHEMRNDMQRARTDYAAALATSDKFNNSKWAKDFARQRLQVLGQ